MWAFFIEEGIQWGLLDLTNIPPRLGWAGLAVDKAAVCCDVAAAQGPDCFTRLSQGPGGLAIGFLDISSTTCAFGSERDGCKPWSSALCPFTGVPFSG